MISLELCAPRITLADCFTKIGPACPAGVTDSSKICKLTDPYSGTSSGSRTGVCGLSSKRCSVQENRHNLTVELCATEKKYQAIADTRRRFMPAQNVARMVLELALLLCLSAGALAQMPNRYGVSISVEDAKKAAALSLAEARKNNWTVAVAVV